MEVKGDLNIDGTLTVNNAPVTGGSGLNNVVEDTTPQLGGNLDVNGFAIEGADHTGGTDGGDVNIAGGDSDTGRAGDVNLVGGFGTAAGGIGGAVSLNAGDGDSSGADVNITAGFGNTDGGSVFISPGGGSSGNDGFIFLGRGLGNGSLVSFVDDAEMGLHRITNLGTPVDPADAATKAYVDGGGLPNVVRAEAFYLFSGGNISATGDDVVLIEGFNVLLNASGQIDLASGGVVTINAPALDLNGSIIQNVGEPSAPGDAATKNYVDSQSSGGGGGFYGIVWSDGTNTKRTDRLSFNHSEFYLDGRKPTLNIKESGISHSLLANLSADDHSQYIRVDGTRAFTGNQSHGGFKITSLGTPTAATDGATKDYVDTTVGPGFYGIYTKLSNNTAVTLNDTLVFLTADFDKSTSSGKPLITLSTAIARKTDIGPGFYGIFVRETDGNPPTYRNDTIFFDSTAFYLNSDSKGRPIVSFRGSASGSSGISGVDVNDGVSTYTAATAIGFSGGGFYLSRGTGGRPVVNLRQELEPLSVYLDAGMITKVAMETFSEHAQVIEDIQFVTRSGSATGGFYIVRAANPTHRDGTRVTGADPISFSTTPGYVVPTANKTLAVGDALFLNVYGNANAKGIRVKVRLRRT